MTDDIIDPPVHPGEILKSEFLLPLGISESGLAEAIRLPGFIVGALIRGDQRISGNLALRLGRYLGTSAEFWMTLQSIYDIAIARRDFAPTLSKIKPLTQETSS